MDSLLQSKLADAVSGRPLPVFIKDDRTGETREFEIVQPTFAMLMETSRILSDIGISNIQQLFEGQNTFKFIVDHGEKVLQVIAIILERRPDYTQETFDYLKNNLTPAECFDLLSNILLRIGTQDFQKSIIALTPMSLMNQRELIALINKNHSTPSSLSVGT